MSKRNKDELVCERYIEDFVGNEISPGNIVGTGRVSEKNLVAYVVTRVTKSKVYFGGKKLKRCLKLDSNGKPIMQTVKNWLGNTYQRKQYEYTQDISTRKSYSELSSATIQRHLALVKNPLYAIHNPQMKDIIDTVDILKEQGIFPPDYKLGESIVEYIEKTEE